MSSRVRALFVSQPARAYGEINVVVPLAESLLEKGGDAWFLVSPLAARVARARFPDRTFELCGNRELNQNTFWRMVKKFRPDIILFSALHEVLHPRRKLECPLINWRWLEDINAFDVGLIFIDFIAHVPGLQEALDCPECAPMFGEAALRAFFQRLWTILPCPLNEPCEVEGRRGIPYRTETLPLRIQADERAAIRARFLDDDGILILRGGANWQSTVAEQFGVHLYDHLGEVLGLYLSGFPKPVCLVSVSDSHELAGSEFRNFRIVNIRNVPPQEYQKLLLSADLLVTDNEIGYTLARSIGHAPGVVLVNSYTLEQVFTRTRTGSRLHRIVLDMERTSPGSIFPYRVYPLAADPRELVPIYGNGDTTFQNRSCLLPQNLRLGRMPSSPFFRAEIFGGDVTRDFFEWLLLDPLSKTELRREEASYLERLSNIEDGGAVIRRLVKNSSDHAHTVI